MSSLKHLKEQFVSDLSGGSIGEIYLVTSVALTSYLAHKFIKDSISQLPLVYDYIINVLTVLSAITIYSNRPVVLHYSILLPSLFIYLINHYTTQPRKNESAAAAAAKQEHEAVSTILPKKSFLTTYRSHMLIITNLSILAVDFKVFPRRFAKVETWGTSMMDLGVGSFVFSMGLFNSRQLIKNHTKYRFDVKTYLNVIKTNTIKAIPVLVLGIARIVSVKQLDYQEHVSEYGVHWNFFVTLGLLPIFIGILDPILNLVPRVVVAFALALVNEYLLKKTNIIQFIIMSDNRLDNWITMNKEGIYSLLGYFTIFLFGQSVGSFVLTEYPTKNNLLVISNTKVTVTRKKKTSLLSSLLTVTPTQGLIFATVFYQVVFNLVNESITVTSISRRLANFSYILWVVSYNSTLLLGYNLIDKFVPTHKKQESSYLLDSINNNGLLIFLLGNLLTGLVNMSFNTLEMSNTAALVVLIGYSILWSTIAIFLNHERIYLKL